ncbi:hypothetical protein [Amycolatopsis sp. WAC 04169]|uniref:hypothetical protein n=1 Tax=Amycolatopsis sp. WAC 04169 TaxID=2203197 RepID=UPI0018F69A7A|nr:hypothetical protein [Amycolatopsis sp. WAC 04169]
MSTENDPVRAVQGNPPTAGGSSEPILVPRGIRLVRLRLKGIDRDYEVDFRDTDTKLRSLSVIAGAFSTGKSSVLEFVVYCLGGKDHPQHPEILRKVRSALLEVQLNGQPHVIERAVGEPSTAAFVRTGRLGDIETPPLDKKMIKPAGAADSLSSFLLSYCGLEGVELREAPTQAESGTDPLSIRDLLWLSYMPNERLDDKHLLFESSPMKRLKLGQVVDVVFGVHDDKAVELGRRIRELENRLAKARAEYTTTQAFLDEQEFGTRIEIELVRGDAEQKVEQVTRALETLDTQIHAASTFAADLRARHRDASRQAQQTAALVRDRETQLRRLVPLRAQYAADITKLTMLAEARMLFDPLQVKVCPACLTVLRDTPHIADGHCTLCSSEVNLAATKSTGTTASTNGSSANNTAPGTAGTETEAKFDVSTELRATKARLAEITTFVEELESELGRLRVEAKQANDDEAGLAHEVDAATNAAVSPYLSHRDDLMRQQQAAAASLDRAKTAIRMLDSLDRRGVTVTRLESNVDALRAEMNEAAMQPDRNDVIHRISERYVAILTSWRYPKLDQAFIDGRLVPHMRGMSYTNASSGGRTLISLAWILAIFQIAWETGSAHPGFLMIDSPQKNLGQGGDRDAEFADSIAVTDFYQHLHTWLAGAGKGAQIIVVDNAPPSSTEPDVVVRYSRREDQPPYGLIEDEVS